MCAFVNSDLGYGWALLLNELAFFVGARAASRSKGARPGSSDAGWRLVVERE